MSANRHTFVDTVGRKLNIRYILTDMIDDADKTVCVEMSNICDEQSGLNNKQMITDERKSSHFVDIVGCKLNIIYILTDVTDVDRHVILKYATCSGGCIRCDKQTMCVRLIR